MSKSEPWSDCFGQPAADMRMAEIHLRRAVRRAQRMAERVCGPCDADRQRRNLEQFDDVAELARAWRAGNVSWDYGTWGPDPEIPVFDLRRHVPGSMVMMAEKRSPGLTDAEFAEQAILESARAIALQRQRFL